MILYLEPISNNNNDTFIGNDKFFNAIVGWRAAFKCLKDFRHGLIKYKSSIHCAVFTAFVVRDLCRIMKLSFVGHTKGLIWTEKFC